MPLGNLALRVLLVGAMGAVAAWIVRRRGARKSGMLCGRSCWR